MPRPLDQIEGRLVEVHDITAEGALVVTNHTNGSK